MTTESAELQSLLKSLEHPDLKSIDLSLERIESHLAAIDNPQLRVPPVVHVAGTNGKGSTIAFIRAILEAAGYSCHVFTSPHLLHFKERFVVAGQTPCEEEIISRLKCIKKRMDEYPLTFFEANTVAAFEMFAENPADITLLEVGMGGRFDATNILPNPAVTVITPVAMDHEAFLGDSLAEIAYEKAGIIKNAVPVVIAPQEPDAARVIEKVAYDNASPMHWVEARPWDGVSLHGEHQHVNASVAVAVCKLLEQNGFGELNQTSVQDGLSSASWRGRLQKLYEGELLEAAPAGCELWVDGGHNAAAARVLVDWISSQDKPVHLICAMTQQKDALAFLRKLAPKVASVAVTDIPNEPLSMPRAELFNAAKTLNIDAKQYRSEVDAVVQIPENSIGLLAGSLYFVGSILEKNR